VLNAGKYTEVVGSYMSSTKKHEQARGSSGKSSKLPVNACSFCSFKPIILETRKKDFQVPRSTRNLGSEKKRGASLMGKLGLVLGGKYREVCKV
jgi:hypothetical protein